MKPALPCPCSRFPVGAGRLASGGMAGLDQAKDNCSTVMPERFNRASSVTILATCAVAQLNSRYKHAGMTTPHDNSLSVPAH
jgi:hypothetical protein